MRDEDVLVLVLRECGFTLEEGSKSSDTSVSPSEPNQGKICKSLNIDIVGPPQLKCVVLSFLLN
jgi:hypothetical protein